MTADELAAIGFGAYMLEPTVPPFLPSLKVLTYGGHFVLTPGLCYPPAISKSLHSFWNIQEILISQNAQQTIHLLPYSKDVHNHYMVCWNCLKARGLELSIQSFRETVTSLDEFRPLIPR